MSLFEKISTYGTTQKKNVYASSDSKNQTLFLSNKRPSKQKMDNGFNFSRVSLEDNNNKAH